MLEDSTVDVLAVEMKGGVTSSQISSELETVD